MGSLTRYGSAVTYDFGWHDGRAVLALRVASPGQFKVTATGAPASGADLALGGSIGSGITSTLLPGIPLIVLGALGAIAVMIVRIITSRSIQTRYASPTP